MKQLFMSAVALGLLFTACKKDDKTTTTPKPDTDTVVTPVKLLAKIISKTDSTIFTYDTTKNLALYEAYWLDENSSHYIKPVYENNKVTALMSGADKNSLTVKAMTFQYNTAGKLVSSVLYDIDDQTPNQFDSLAYDANGRVAALYIAEQPTEAGHLAFFEKTAFEWDSKGNVVKSYYIRIEDGVESKDTSTTVYTYDDKVNFKAKQPVFFLFDLETVQGTLSANNMLTQSISFSDYKETKEVVYTYDEENYPVTIKTTRKTVNNAGDVTSSKVEESVLTYIKK